MSEQNRIDYLFDVNYAVSSQSNTIIIYISMSQLNVVNPFKPNGISLSHHLDWSISVLRVAGWYFSFLFKFYYNILLANSGNPDKTQRFVVSDLGLHYLPMPHKKDTMLI